MANNNVTPSLTKEQIEELKNTESTHVTLPSSNAEILDKLDGIEKLITSSSLYQNTEQLEKINEEKWVILDLAWAATVLCSMRLNLCHEINTIRIKPHIVLQQHMLEFHKQCNILEKAVEKYFQITSTEGK